MNDKKFTEFSIATVLVLLLVLLANPFHFWMPGTMQMLVLASVAVVFAVYAVFVWRERAADEREAAHRMFADRIAFVTGAAVIVLGIAIETFSHRLDTWLVGALIAMVLAKAIALYYSRSRW
ncbi:hypothetical protein COV04_01305 [Candidatus Uhrbacteria bacterium CG10_big_fil_rev_8_21_14_0_10_48_11]|uniref:Uncharacterized protein n=1 Tax=Candidatus Uhrbacteria bacterium CG10_big_fil_rev_8_21_14_0_10_48_11 TaxID=1975037 RepID=A0A2M8LFC9_9BACT|nr:MAG: hypothetical protein COV04_01305 [Candidatus Uhrbacteria bacterium CG10_big_fil_rev_8_21_14_0_10_48_11]